MLVDTELLNKKIDESGLRITFIVNTLGISRNGFDMKRKGITPFRGSEMYVLCDLLNLNREEKEKIFYPKSKAITDAS